ncbi:hypothetical protein M569_03696 [Genlisea aurea]|uniref:GRAM domain-containing protein n=1 Tax=Genlisea aurea TaxID=192259 RepID=S8D148_9LAMI|nr:hypothetical protein M569_03696 [Genlisea aurea]
MAGNAQDQNPRGNGSSPPEDVKKLGTHLMGHPAPPTVHPDNRQAALWQAQGPAPQYYYTDQPYVLYSPIPRSGDNSRLDSVVNSFNTWSRRAEDMATNIWHNLRTGQSVCEAAWGKANLAAKAVTEGGFESLFRQIFQGDPNERLKKTFASYLSTSTGPVAGTLYLSTARVAFCSDRPLSFRAPSGQQIWSYYKVSIPLGNIESVIPVSNPPEKYIHVVTVDGHEFWFMGFVSFEKASHHLLDTVSDFKATAQQSLPIS